MLCARRGRRFSADLMQSVANEGRGATLCREIPNIAGDYTIRATNATHFTKCLRWIRNEVNRKSRNDDIEGLIRERQLLRVRNAEIHSFRDWFLTRKLDLRLRRIDRDDCSRRTRTDYKFGKYSSATTEIEPVRINARCQPIEKDRTHGTSPAAHETLIGGAVAKKLRLLSHFAPPLLRLNRRLSKYCVPTTS